MSASAVMESREDSAGLPMSAIYEANPSSVSRCGPASVQIAPIVCVDASARMALVEIARCPMNQRRIVRAARTSHYRNWRAVGSNALGLLARYLQRADGMSNLKVGPLGVAVVPTICGFIAKRH